MRVRTMAYAILFSVATLAVSSPVLAQTAPALREPDVIFVPTPAATVDAIRHATVRR